MAEVQDGDGVRHRGGVARRGTAAVLQDKENPRFRLC